MYSDSPSRKLYPTDAEIFSQYQNCNRWAIVVGISKYKHAAWNLRYAHRDAEEFYKLITSLNGGGFKPEHIRRLTNEAATTSNIQRAFRSFLKKPSREDLVVVYLACHGTPDPEIPKNLYLVTHDTDPDDISGTALPMREIRDALQHTLQAEKIVIFADACHSAAIGGGIGTRRVLDDSTLINTYLKDLSRSTAGTALLASSEANETSKEDVKWGGGHGVFTYYLLEGMRGAADKDKNGIVTVGELFDYVTESVHRATDYKQHPTKGTDAFDRSLPIAVVDVERYLEQDLIASDVTQELALTTDEMLTGTEKSVFTGRENVTVKIPAGVSLGKRIRLEGKGNFFQGSQERGDLYLLITQIQSAPSSRTERVDASSEEDRGGSTNSSPQNSSASPSNQAGYSTLSQGVESPARKVYPPRDQKRKRFFYWGLGSSGVGLLALVGIVMSQQPTITSSPGGNLSSKRNLTDYQSDPSTTNSDESEFTFSERISSGDDDTQSTQFALEDAGSSFAAQGISGMVLNLNLGALRLALESGNIQKAVEETEKILSSLSQYIEPINSGSIQESDMEEVCTVSKYINDNWLYYESEVWLAWSKEDLIINHLFTDAKADSFMKQKQMNTSINNVCTTIHNGAMNSIRNIRP